MKSLRMFAPALMLLGCIACSQSPVHEAATVSSDLPATEVSATFDTPRAAALAAASSNKAAADAAIAHLRKLGPAGLAALKEVHGAEIAFRLGEVEKGSAPDAVASDRVLRAFDKVSGQHDGWASGLYWHTDAQAARADAQARGLPILNLVLLGTLDDEFC